MNRTWTALSLIAALLAFACDRAGEPEQARITPAAPVVLRLQVDGMHCQGCVDAITDKVKRVDGVVDCRVSLQDRQADVAVRDAALAGPVQQAMETLHYKVKPLPASEAPATAPAPPAASP